MEILVSLEVVVKVREKLIVLKLKRYSQYLVLCLHPQNSVADGSKLQEKNQMSSPKR